jgi:hypothetical protein
MYDVVMCGLEEPNYEFGMPKPSRRVNSRDGGPFYDWVTFAPAGLRPGAGGPDGRQEKEREQQESHGARPQ